MLREELGFGRWSFLVVIENPVINDLPEARLEVKFTAESRLALSAADLPTKTENAPIIGESVIHDLQKLKNRREQEVAFLLAKLTLEKYFRQDGAKNTEKASKKVTTAQTLWVPAVNGHGEFGRWAFLEIRDPWDAKNEIRTALPQKNV